MTKSQQRKAAQEAAREVQSVLSAVLGVQPESIPVCTECTSFCCESAEKCFMQLHNGDIPKKGFCNAFAADPAKDPRDGKVLAGILRQTSGENVAT